MNDTSNADDNIQEEAVASEVPEAGGIPADGQAGKSDKPKDEKKGPDGTDYAKADFENLQDESSGDKLSLGSKSLEMILDIPVTVSVEIGRTRISVSNLLKLNQGSVVELDRLAGEPMDITVNGTLVAHGEVVVVNEKFGIRLTDVVSTAERIKKLR